MTNALCSLRPMFLLGLALAGFTSLTPGCGGDDDDGVAYPYAKNSARLVEKDADEVVVEAEPNACIVHKGNACIKTAEHCPSGFTAVDLHLDANGNVLAAVCYPTDVYTVESVDTIDGSDLKIDNNEVVALDAADDGADVEGGLVAEGNNAVIYGHGADVAVIKGDVDLRGNNIILRGLRVEGSVELHLNNGSLSNCVITGDLIISGNNELVAGCDVFGKVTIRGNNSYLVNNDIQGGVGQTGMNTRCAGNAAFSDANQNGLVDPGERGAAIACGGGEGEGGGEGDGEGDGEGEGRN
jgi:hypothetical protein